MTNSTARHPFVRVLRDEQGRTFAWLARETGVSHQYVRAVAANLEKGSPRFRAACARVLGRPESDLFHDGSSASPSEGDPTTGSEFGRAGTRLMTRAYPDQEGLPIVRNT